MSTQTANLNIKITADGSAVDKEADRVAARTKNKINDSFKGTSGANSQAKQNSQDSGTARGLGGLTGASARDFASQSQGLGGVVRLYATFAANLFAASAAFGALSRAADTTNMVKGLDQLGAASGRALGSLSKQLVSVTDGAINLREAMTATALASSGGMSNQAILRMGEVAKQASQALGVAMPDAISRLSRGITKLEPELLDEIGIMVRVDRTSQDYAASIGKSAAALTDFEKRQAFANAVLEQGEKKFGAIKIDANPYAKILASMENIAQKGLELVNTVFTPLLTILSSSPTALATAMAGVAAILLKQAIPALGSFKESLRISAENGTKLANLRSIEAKKASLEEVAQARKTAEDVAEVRIAAVDKNVAAQQKLLAASKFKSGSAIGNIFAKPTQELEDKDFRKIEIEAKKAASKGNEALAQTYRDGAIALKQSIAAEKAYSDVVKKTTDEIARRQSITSTAGQFQKSVDRDNLASASRNITSRAAETAATQSFGKAWKDAAAEVRIARSGPQIKDIADGMGNITKQTVPAMGAMQSFWTMTKVGAVSAISAIGTALSAFMGWIAIIGFAVGVLGSFVSWMSTSEKETEKLVAALTGLNDAAENASKTLDSISQKTFSETLDPKSIQARATAFLEVSDSISKTAQSYRNLLNAQSDSDKAVESFFSFFGRGDSDKLAKSLGTTISNSLELLSTNPKAKKAAEDALNSLFGKDIDLQSPQALTQALKGMSTDKLSETSNAISNLFKKVSTDVNNAASNLTSFTDALAATSKLVSESNAKLVPQDENGKFGAGLITQGLLLSKVLEEGPIQSLAALNSLVNDTKSLSLLPPAAVDQIVKASAAAKELQDQLGENNKRQIQAEKALSAAIQARKKNNPNENAINDYLNPGLVNAIAEQKKVVADLNKEREQLSADASKFTKLASEGLTIAIFDAGAKRLTLSLESAMTAAAVVAGGAYLSVLKGIGGDTAAEEGKLRLMEIQGQRDALVATYASIEATTKLELTMREDAANRKMESVRNMTGGSLEGKNATTLAATKELEAIARERAIISQKDPAKSLKALSSKDTTKEDRDAFAAQSSYVQSLIGFKSQMAMLDAKTYASKITQMAGEEGERVKNQQKEYDDLNKNLAIRKSNIEIAQKLSGTYDAGLAASAKQVELEVAKNESLKIQKELQGKINIAKELGSNKEAQKASKKAEEDIAREKLSLLQKNKEIESKFTTEKLVGETALYKLQEERNATERSNLYDTKIIGLNIQEQTLKYAKELGVLEAGATTLGLADIAIQRQELGYKKELADLTSKEILDLQAKQSTLDKIKANNSIIPAEGQIGEYVDPKEAQAALDAATKAYVDQKANLDAKNASTITELQLTAERNAMQEVFNDQLKITADLTTSLSALFGEMGDNIGGAVTALTKMAHVDEKYMSDRIKLENEYINTKDGSDEEKASIEKLAKLDNKNKINKIKSIGEVAGASKKMFKEETVAYKILDGLEKASNVIKFATLAKEIAMELGLMGIKTTSSAVAITGATAEASVSTMLTAIKAKEGIAQIWSKTPPWVAVGMTAAFLGLLGMGSGGGGSMADPTAANTSEGMQKLGSGQSYAADGSTIISNGRGVLGDEAAQSDAVNKSLERIRDTSVEGLVYTNKMVSILEDIRDGTRNVASGIARVQGISSGRGFTEYANKEAGAQKAEVFRQGSGWLEYWVHDIGLKFTGTFSEVMKDVGSNISFYEKGRTKTSTGQETDVVNSKPLEKSALRDIRLTMESSSELLIQMGAKLNKSSTEVSAVLDALPVDLERSLAGLSGDDLSAALDSMFSGILDKASEALFGPIIDMYAKMGESGAETLIRLIDDSEKVQQVFQTLGRDSITVIGEAGFAFSEAMITAAGGLDEFISDAKFFSDTFLTEAERINPVYKSLTASLADLGMSSITTREMFKTTILTWSDWSASGIEAYNSLNKLGPAFDSVIGYVEQLTGLTSTSLSDLFKDGLLGKLDASELGKQVSEKIEEGIYNAVATGFADQISSMFVDQIVNPMVTAILTGGALTEAISKQTLDNIVSTATASAAALSTLFQDEGFKAALASIKSAVSTISVSTTNVTNKPYTYTPKAVESAKETISDAQKEVEGLRKELQGLIDQGLSPAALLEAQRARLLSEEAKIIFDQITAQKALLKAREDQKQFDLKYIDVLESISVGTTKINATYTKMASTLKTGGAAGSIEEIATGLKGLSIDSITDFIWSLDDVTSVSAETKLVLLGVASSLLEVKKASKDAEDALEVRILNAQGNSAAALVITRAKELELTEDSLRPRLKYLHAMEDEATLREKLKVSYDKQIDSLKDLMGKLKDTSKSIKEYQKSLALGDLSNLTPEQKYNEAKVQALDLVKIINDTTATDDARIEAANRLPQAADAILNASKTLFASGSQYQEDYSTVQTYLSSLTGVIDTVVSDQDKNLNAILASEGYLESIKDDTKTSTDYLRQIAEAAKNTETARLASVASGSGASGYLGKYQDVADAYSRDTNKLSKDQFSAVHYAMYGKNEGRVTPGAIGKADAEAIAGALGVSFEDVSTRLDTAGIKGYRNGGLASGISLVGEEGPELVDFKTPGRVYGNNASNSMLNNKELIEEIRNLRKEVAMLRAEQKEQTGHIITSNYDASSNAAKTIAGASKDAAATQVWAQRAAPKLA